MDTAARGARRARSQPLRLAKFTTPKLSGVLPRPRLLLQLDQLATHKLIWIAAPAGSGKTTLVADYLASRKRAHLWYQVDAGDQDIAAFFNNLAQAVERENRLKHKLARFTPEYAQGLPAFSRNFFRAFYFRIKTPACVIFDNYQDVGDPSVLDSVLAHALAELPPGITLIALSRSVLPASLARQDANGTVGRLDAESLALTTEEQAALVQQTLGDHPLRTADLARLRQATGGWMTGMMLALRAIKASRAHEAAQVIEAITQAPAQDPASIFNYFATEVMAQLDSGTRDFLYTVALLPVMTVPLCEALTGYRDAKGILKRLVHEHFFTTRCGLLTVSYEFHPLFRQFLLAEAENAFDPERLQSLRRQAGRILAEAGEIEQAATWMIATQDWSTLAELICNYGAALEKQGRHQTLNHWLGALPESICVANPWLLYWQGIAQTPTAPDLAYELLERAYPLFLKQDDAIGLYHCWIGVTTALYFRHDDINPAHGWAEELERLRQRHPKWPSLEVQGRMTTAAVGILFLVDPQSPAFAAWLARAEKLYRFIPITAVRCFVGYQLGMYYSVFGQISKLTAIVEQLSPLIDSPKVPDTLRLLVNSLVILAAWQSANLPAAEAAIVQGIDLHETSGVHITAQWFFISACITMTAHGKLDKAEEYAAQLRKYITPKNVLATITLHYTSAWRNLLRGQYPEARSRLEPVLPIVEAQAHTFILIQGHCGLTQILIELGEFTAARDQLAKVRELATAQGNRLILDFYANFIEAYLLDRSGASRSETLEAIHRGFAAGAQMQVFVMTFWQPKLIARLCVLALQHNIEPQYAKRLIKSYRLVPPEQDVPIEQWPWPIRIYTLGRFTLVKDDQPLATTAGKGHKKPLELLHTLIALGGRQVGVENIINLLWPDAEGDAGVNLFKITLHRLRKLLGHESAIDLAEGRLTLNSQEVWVDSWALARILTDVEAKTNDPAYQTDAVRRALALYRGHFLEREGEGNPALLRHREQLRVRILHAVKGLLGSLERAGDWAELIHHSERAIELDELDEDFHAAVLRGYLAQGQPALALRAYERARRIYQGLNLQPSSRLETLRRVATGDAG